MARQRRSKAAPKRTERPVADVILGPLAELPLAPDLADEIEMLWAVLGPVGHQRFAAGHADHASMLADTQRLASQVRERAARKDFHACLLRDMARADDGTDNFADEYAAYLAKLVRRDPRYLASDLVVGTVLLWKLQVIRGMQHARTGAKQKRGVVAERAREYLRDLAGAAIGLAVVTGRGRQEFIDPIVLLADYEHHVDVVCDVIEMINSDKCDEKIVIEIIDRAKRDDEITRVPKLSLASIAAIQEQPHAVKQHAKELLVSIAAIREQPRAVKQHAEQLTLALYGLSFEPDRLRRLLADARAALDPRPPGWPRPRRARRGKLLVPTGP